MYLTEKLSRRRFAGTAIFASLASLVPFALMGCGVFSDILAWTSVASVAIDGIVTVLGPFMPPGGATVILAIKSFLADLAGAASEYESDTNPADKATLLAKIRTLLTDIAMNFQSFLAQINLGNNPIVAVVLGLAQVILAAIAGFLGQLPTPTTIPIKATVGGKPLSVVPKYYKRVADFKKDYNAVCAANSHPEIELK